MEQSNSLRWVRLSNDKMVAGVASGLARQLDVDTWVIRLVWALSALITFGGSLLLYLACVIAFPRSDKADAAQKKMILGVCARIHQRGDIEVGLARLIALLLLVGTGGAALVGYIVLYFVLSKPNEVY
ncbi:MAG: PspC domain-containing protein [Bdellovibrionales bacterium]